MKKGGPPYRNPWLWVPSLYLAEGLPYVVVMTVSVVLYKRLNVSNTDIALYTSWLYLPWVIKPFWSPLVDMFRTKRFWIVAMQVLTGASLAAVALTIPLEGFFRYTLAVFWLMAFSSATHDIAADGFYMLGLREYQQAAFIGVRSLFYRIAMIAAQGALVVLAGYLEGRCASIPWAWSITFFVLAAVLLSFFLYHLFVLPVPPSDRPSPRDGSRGFFRNFLNTFVLFFRRKDILAVIAFLLFYRFAEAQLVKMVVPFLLDPRSAGGLGLSTAEVGVAYGTVGILMLVLGGLLGGYVISRQGLRFWIWIMVVMINVPDLVFVYLSQAMPGSFAVVTAAIAAEQFGYGFGFTAYALFMIMVSEGEHKTVHYALCTGFMALGMMVPGMVSGWLQEHLGYPNFFLWIMISTLPAFVVPALVRIDPEFGRGQGGR